MLKGSIYHLNSIVVVPLGRVAFVMLVHITCICYMSPEYLHLLVKSYVRYIQIQ